MPHIDGIPHKPEEAIAKGRCPECGRDLAQSSADVEIQLHWPRGLRLDVASPEAIERANMIREYYSAKEHN